jgi:hypothetical protein
MPSLDRIPLRDLRPGALERPHGNMGFRSLTFDQSRPPDARSPPVDPDARLNGPFGFCDWLVPKKARPQKGPSPKRPVPTNPVFPSQVRFAATGSLTFLMLAVSSI